MLPCRIIIYYFAASLFLFIHSLSLIKMKSSIKILRSTICACISLIIVGTYYTDDAEKQANSLFNIYESVCLKYVNNMDVARKKLQPFPKLPPEKAAHFPVRQAGTVWPFPDQHGVYI